MGAYTNTGPFNLGGAPGINNTFLNNVENFIQQLQGSLNTVVLNGGTSGTATLYQLLQGTFKYTFIQLNNFRTAGSAQQITLPVAYTFGGCIRTYDTEAVSIRSGGVDQTVRVLTALPASAAAAGGVSTGNVFNSWQIADTFAGFNQFNFGASWAAVHSGYVIIEGI